MKAQVQWMSPVPMWSANVAKGRDVLTRPSILRFESDTFMEDLAKRLEAETIQLSDLEATPKSYQARPFGLGEAPPTTLKLYQPAHGHFYLLAANLVCRLPGMPDHRVDVAKKEKVSFVMRRVVADPDGSGGELEQGWMVKGETLGWQSLSDPAAVPEGEERLPMFPLNFQDGKQGRRLFVGYVPVSSRDTYQAPAGQSPIVDPATAQGQGEEDPRLAELSGEVILAHLEVTGSVPAVDRQAASLFILFDLADLLRMHVPDVWNAIVASSSAGLSTAELALYDRLGVWKVDAYSTGTKSWRTALKEVGQEADAIATSGTSSHAYDLLYSDLPRTSDGKGELYDKVKAALPPLTPESAPAAFETTKVPKLDPQGGEIFVLRTVYERPACLKERGPVVSVASSRFQLAPFFDPDAPARPIRISLPADTSIAGLRKYTKNVAFSMSKELRNQMERISDKTLQEGTVDGLGGFNLGHICSLSIPIITLCAFILLFVIVIVLNIVFWWMPFFKICFPLSFKAK